MDLHLGPSPVPRTSSPAAPGLKLGHHLDCPATSTPATTNPAMHPARTPLATSTWPMVKNLKNVPDDVNSGGRFKSSRRRTLVLNFADRGRADFQLRPRLLDYLVSTAPSRRHVLNDLVSTISSRTPFSTAPSLRSHLARGLVSTTPTILTVRCSSKKSGESEENVLTTIRQKNGRFE